MAKYQIEKETYADGSEMYYPLKDGVRMVDDFGFEMCNKRIEVVEKWVAKFEGSEVIE